MSDKDPRVSTDAAAEARRLATAHMMDGPPYVHHLYDVCNTLRACAVEIERLKAHSEYWTTELQADVRRLERERDAALDRASERATQLEWAEKSLDAALEDLAAARAAEMEAAGAIGELLEANARVERERDKARAETESLAKGMDAAIDRLQAENARLRRVADLAGEIPEKVLVYWDHEFCAEFRGALAALPSSDSGHGEPTPPTERSEGGTET